MAAGGLIFLLLILLIPLAASTYILYTRIRAQRAGLPPPSLSSYNPFAKRIRPSQNYPAPSGFLGWARSKFQSLGGSRSRGVYEEPLGRRGAQGSDPDEAWDARVGNEADGYSAGGYYEEQELDFQPSLGAQSYAGSGYGERHGQVLPNYGSEEIRRGRSMNRSGESPIGGTDQGLDRRYDEEMRRGDPFGDDAERSDLRGLSPRPIDNDERGHKKTDSGDSATERKNKKMGIPRMFGHLQTLAVPKILGCKTSGCSEHQNRQSIIIDGPSLAFYINYRILAQRASSTTPLDAIPSYIELEKATLAFLDELQKHGASIDSIFFDGFLPLDKSGVRKARLEASLNQLSTFHAVSLDGFYVSKSASHASPITAPQLFDPLKSIPASLRGIPVPAFLVPAVMDALQNSDYASVTAVVPDEADPFCAGTACKNGGIILTSDSDLLVYDLGTHGAVAFFSQLELRTDEESSRKCDVFRASISQPFQIAQRLGLENLKQFSFELLRDSSISLTDIVRRAKQKAPEPLPYDASRQKTFHEYCKDYDIKTFNFKTDGMKELLLTCEIEKPQLLDPRISELILSSASLPSFYLPLLVEEPSRASAWNVSQDLRQFAYSCLNYNISDSTPESIVEYGRRGQRIEPEVIQTLSKKKVVSYSNKLAAGLETFMSLFCEFPNAIIWKTFALSEILHQCAENQKTPLSRSVLASQFTGQVNRKITWLYIHLSAQVEAVLFSLRMLKQILRHSRTLPISQPSEPLAKQPSPNDGFLRLSAILDTLPPLSQLLPSRLELATQPPLSTANVDRLLDLLVSHIQAPPSPIGVSLEGENTSSLDKYSEDGFQTVPNKKRRQVKNSQDVKPTSAPIKDSSKSNSNNMFNALLQS